MKAKARRDIGQEILDGIRQLKRGVTGRVTRVAAPRTSVRSTLRARRRRT